ncbi:MAG: hypothetical protein GF311_16795 [Candidatus Lokiarchaeota archaeon]|nr:hypothetical protein [Candidatus Lokiarchaeota archaeon]
MAEKKFRSNCSKLKKWFEQDYNPKLLKDFSAFNLLKKLSEVGDPLAERIFRNEIISAFRTGKDSIVTHLKGGGFLNYLNQNQMRELLINKYNDQEKELHLSELGLNRIPKFIFEIDDIKILDLESNSLESISDSIESLIHLQTLNLDYNNLKSLPESIGNLKSLKILSAINNKLEELPYTIGNLTSLEIVDLGANPNPRVFGTNKLKEVPESIGNLTSLISLDLEENHLKSLPDSIGNLKNLEELLLGGNNLKTLPESILNLNSDLMFTIWGNPCLENGDPIAKKCLNHFQNIYS